MMKMKKPIMIFLTVLTLTACTENKAMVLTLPLPQRARRSLRCVRESADPVYSSGERYVCFASKPSPSLSLLPVLWRSEYVLALVTRSSQP